MTQVFTTPEEIETVRLITLKHALSLEMRGMKRRGESAFAIAKRIVGNGSKLAVWNRLCKLVEERIQARYPASFS